MCDPRARVKRELQEIREAFAAIAARLDVLLDDRPKPPRRMVVRTRPDGWTEGTSNVRGARYDGGTTKNQKTTTPESIGTHWGMGTDRTEAADATEETHHGTFPTRKG
jgi:hypothetical protein